jgi:hypothetical protein
MELVNRGRVNRYRGDNLRTTISTNRVSFQLDRMEMTRIYRRDGEG